MDRAKEIRSAVCRYPITTAQSPLSITVSVGAIASRSLILVTVEGLLCEVDRALYTAKAAGRNCSRLAGVGV